ncbi:hypothetical protein DL764_005366 [Monosporascus ibericus]|uniref:Uncharacterized protein n=1 Tax=Monosporascus ibericus TaxID=155417 RepID=A0A4Q4TB93_9PEZI|nr:hypothetical protein DL764_005366 [Monosporascus ibericus]
MWAAGASCFNLIDEASLKAIPFVRSKMSFGFSIADFITVAQLATNIRKEFVEAPSRLKKISDESLSSVVQDADVVASESEA